VIGKGPVAEIPGQTDFNPVGVFEQCAQLRGGRLVLIRKAAWFGEQASGKALDSFIGERATASNAVANTVVERANAGAKQVFLAEVNGQPPSQTSMETAVIAI
jgi:hypothetical protein